MLRIVVLTTFVLALAAGNPRGGLNPITPQGRIVGGRETSIEEHPWQASLQAYGFHFCGGSIISESVILTAGHCTVSYPAERLTVRVGSARTANGGQLIQVDKIVRHENYRAGKRGVPENDVAVLRLKTAIQLNTTAKPIALFDADVEAEEGVLSTITGWGATSEGGHAPGVLHAVDVPIISKSVCAKAYESWNGIPSGQICAAYPQGGRDSCQGDSGGPLVIAGVQVGITSWGNGCARRNWPGVYTEIAAVRDWIAKNAGV